MSSGHVFYHIFEHKKNSSQTWKTYFFFGTRELKTYFLPQTF